MVLYYDGCILLHDHDNMVGIPNVLVMCKQLKISH